MTDPVTGFHSPPAPEDIDDSIEANAPRFVDTVDDVILWDEALPDPPLPEGRLTAVPRVWILPDPVMGPLSDAIVDGDGNVLPDKEPFVRWAERRPEPQAQSIAGAFRAGIVPPNVQDWWDRWELETGQS